MEGCLESTLGAGFGSACECMALGGGRGPRRMVRLARLLHRRGRVLGGPAVRAACGGDQLLRTALPKETRVTGALAGRLGKATTKATLGRQGRSRWLVYHNRRYGQATAV
jgi:hypothetical protein